MPSEDTSPSLSELTALFRDLGAPDPESWARSQLREGIPQLARFLFLKAAWEGVVTEIDSAWIQREIDTYRGRVVGVGAGAGRALLKLLDLGADREHITDLVRTMQWETLQHICDVIDDVRDDYRNPWKPEEHWHLVLHEECPGVEVNDPTGREMRPRPTGGGNAKG